MKRRVKIGDGTPIEEGWGLYCISDRMPVRGKLKAMHKCDFRDDSGRIRVSFKPVDEVYMSSALTGISEMRDTMEGLPLTVMHVDKPGDCAIGEGVQGKELSCFST